MTGNGEIHIHIDSETGRIPYSQFITVVNNATGILNSIANSIKRSDAGPVVWNIVGAKMESPMVLKFEAFCKGDNRAGRDAVRHYIDGMNAIENDEIPPKVFTYENLESAKKIVGVLNRKVRSLKFESPTFGVARPTQRVAANVVSLQAKLWKYEWASFRGVLEDIETHEGANNFTIYDALSGRGIRCSFGNVDPEDIGRLLTKRVMVYGRTRYDRTGMPSEIKVEEFRGLNEEPLDIITAEPVNITGGMPSEDYIRKIRNGEPV